MLPRIECIRGINKTVFGVKLPQLFLAERRGAPPEPKLRKAGPAAHQNGEGARRDLGIESTPVAPRHPVELRRVVRDDPREDIEAADRTLRIDKACEFVLSLQAQAFLKRNDVDAAAFEDRASGKINLVHDACGFRKLALDGRTRPRQEGGTHPPRHIAQPEIQARRLQLAFSRRVVAFDC